MRALIRRVRAVPVLLVLAACGSTLQDSAVQTTGAGVPVASSDGLSTVVPGEAGGDGITPSGGVAAGASPGTSGTSGTPGTAGSGGGVGGGTGATSGGAGSPGAAGPAASAPSSNEPIRLGVAATDVGALAAVFGASTDGYDYFKIDKAFVDHINNTGGINGRKLELKTMMVDIAADADAEGQRVCENFTQDNKVDVVHVRVFGAESLIACLRQNGIAVFDLALHTHDRAAIDHPNWIQPLAVGLDRLVRAGIEEGVERGRLKAGDTLGVLHEDCSWGRRIYSEVAKPLAESHGVKVVQATVKCVENLVADIAPVTNQARSAVLRFRSEGVTDMMIISFPEHFIWAQFASAAEEQAYRPQYQVTTNAFPYTTSDDAGQIKVPDAQRRNASGLGFVPQQDVGPEAQSAGGAQDAIQAECRKADETMGGATAADPNDQGGRAYMEMTYYIFCDLYFSLRGALQNSGGSTAPLDVVAGFAAYRASAASATLTGGRYGTARLEGGGFVKSFEYNPQTKRFSYGSGQMRALAE